MKAVLMSIQPKWCELIASGKKTVEVRKTKPKLNTPFKVYIYCTKGREKLWVLNETERAFAPEKIASICTAKDVGGTYQANGKVIGEFVCDSIGFYEYDQAFDESMGCYIDKYGYDIAYTDLGRTCLSYEEFESYGNTQNLYGWHITDLVIYDKPRELGEFKRVCDGNCQECKYAIWQTRYPYGDPIIVDCKPISVPQSWCYVEEVR